MYRVGASMYCFPYDDKTFASAREAGISALELYFPYELQKVIDLKAVEQLAKRHELQLWSYHVPFVPFSQIDISSPDKVLREQTIRDFSEAAKRAAGIGVGTIVLHASKEPLEPENRDERIKWAMDSLDKLAEMAAADGAVIAVESLPRTYLGNSAEEILHLISANDKLGICFDTNHMQLDDNISFMKKVAGKIRTLHVSDYNLDEERHWLPGEGNIDWVEFFDTFKNLGYEGVWMYEVKASNPYKLIRERDLTFRDYYENAQCIFSGKQPTPVCGIQKL